MPTTTTLGVFSIALNDALILRHTLTVFCIVDNSQLCTLANFASKPLNLLIMNFNMCDSRAVTTPNSFPHPYKLKPPLSSVANGKITL